MIENLTLIIPTFKREEQLIKILDSLNNQLNERLNIEVIVCDSFSNYDVSKFPKLKENFKLLILNTKKNVLSFKRNYGIYKASNTNLILIDDDCIPAKNFLDIYLNDFKNLDQRTILSGVVDYPDEYLKNSKYIKFRNSKHFKEINIDLNKNLPPNKVVAMNMGFKKTQELISAGLFDERFLGYGFEDYEFAFRYKQKGFKLKKTKAKILHDEGKPVFEKYLKKYYHLGRDGMKNLLTINNISAKDTIYYKIEKNFFFQFFSKIAGCKFFLKLIENFVITIDKYNFFNLNLLYNIARFSSYTRGFIDRSKSNLTSESINWYE